MHHQVAAIKMNQLAASQPIEQLITIRRIENLLDGVALAGLAHAFGNSEQMQVMIAEYDRRAITEAANESQAFQ